MANLGKIIAVLVYYAVAFLAAGTMIRGKRGKEFSFTKAWVTGFFGYYIGFQIVTLPIMFLQLPLSVLTKIWTVLMGAFLLAAFVKYGKLWWKTGLQRVKGLFGRDVISWIPVLVMAANVLLVTMLYVSFWDATYYVGQVSFSVYTDTIHQVDPLSGEFLQVFDLKHCFATYHVNDAVICQLFDIHPLIVTKTVMVTVITVLTNVLYYRLGHRLFAGQKNAVALFMLLALLANVCTYSAYTASGFFMYRTYEGKAITANISIPLVIYLLLGLYRDGNVKETLQRLFFLCWGSVSIASSAMFLVPLTMVAGVVPYALWKKKPAVLLGLCFVALPCLCVAACYFLERLGWLEIAIRQGM